MVEYIHKFTKYKIKYISCGNSISKPSAATIYVVYLKGRNQMENIHDKGYKRIFSNRKVMLHFLRRYFPQAWTRDLKEENLIQVDKEFVQENFQKRESDLIYRIQYDLSLIHILCVGCGRCDDICPEYISFSLCVNQLAKLTESEVR